MLPLIGVDELSASLLDRHVSDLLETNVSRRFMDMRMELRRWMLPRSSIVRLNCDDILMIDQ